MRWDVSVGSEDDVTHLKKLAKDLEAAAKRMGTQAHRADLGIPDVLDRVDTAKAVLIERPEVSGKPFVTSSAIFEEAPNARLGGCVAGLSGWRSSGPPVAPGAAESQSWARRLGRRRRRQGHRGGKNWHRMDKKYRHREAMGQQFPETLIFFAKVTSWIHDAAHYFLAAVQADIRLAAETHKKRPDADGLVRVVCLHSGTCQPNGQK